MTTGPTLDLDTNGDVRTGATTKDATPDVIRNKETRDGCRII